MSVLGLLDGIKGNDGNSKCSPVKITPNIKALTSTLLYCYASIANNSPLYGNEMVSEFLYQLLYISGILINM